MKINKLTPDTVFALTGKLPIGVSVSYSSLVKEYQFWNGMQLIDALPVDEISQVGVVILSVHGMPRVFDRRILSTAFQHPGQRYTVVAETTRTFPRIRCWFRSVKHIIKGAFSK